MSVPFILFYAIQCFKSKLDQVAGKLIENYIKTNDQKYPLSLFDTSHDCYIN